MSDEPQLPPIGQVTVFSDSHDIVFLGWDGWRMTMPHGVEAATGIRRMESRSCTASASTCRACSWTWAGPQHRTPPSSWPMRWAWPPNAFP